MLDLVHSDLLGKITPQSLGGAKYMISFTDDFSKFVVVKFLKTKDETFDSFVEYKNQVESLHDRKIKSFQSDNGTEYINQFFQNLFKDEGISHRKIVAGCPEQNGIAERLNRTIVEMSRCLLIQSGLPEYFWAEAANTSCYIRNLCINSSIDNKIPLALWKGDVNIPKLLSQLRVFGCRVWALINKSLRTKFGAKAEECVFMGYGDSFGVDVKGYKVFCLRSRKMKFKHHIIFEEDVFPYKLDVPRNHVLDLNFENVETNCDSDSDIF